jgi:hypothetical protein
MMTTYQDNYQQLIMPLVFKQLTDQPVTEQSHVDNINWKALYKVLESEVESIILDPNAPRYVSEWGQGVMAKLREKLPR